MSPSLARPRLESTDDDESPLRVCLPAPGKSRGAISWLLGVALVLAGCKDSPVHGKADASTQGPHSVRDAELTPGPLAGEVLDPVRIPQNLLEGALDVSGRYSSTVMIEASPSTTESGARKCSGLLVAPRLVLTAGHCVCSEHEKEASHPLGGEIIDRSACASTATITAVTYQPGKPGAPPRAIYERHQGEVRPHPELRIVIDAQGEITAAHANLALISLTEPVEAPSPPPKLSESEVQLDEPLTTVGYGSDESGPQLYGHRRFNKSRVIRPPEEDERIFLSPPKRLLYQNDSGGPCLRESPAGDFLVGISNRGLGDAATCLSTYVHRDWLRRALLEAAHPR